MVQRFGSYKNYPYLCIVFNKQLKTITIMMYNVGEQVRCLTPAMINSFGNWNIWVIDHIKTRENKPSLYMAYRVNDRNKTLFFFLESEIERTEEINN